MSLNIVVDSHIPHAKDIFSEIGEVVEVPGHEIGPKSVQEADILVVRSITRVDKTLLGNSRVSFVGSATAGIDHIDTEYLSGQGVEFAHAPGANAESVVEYVLSALGALGADRGQDFRRKTIGIVGCGNVGSRLAERCTSLEMKVIQNDPPRAIAEGDAAFADLPSLMTECDIISVHTPLTESGTYATRGLISRGDLSLLKEGAWLIHTARGGVCVEQDLVAARNEGVLSALVLDVWENEPTPNLDAINRADIATGHIAGYSWDAKRKGVEMISNEALRHFGILQTESLVRTGQSESLQSVGIATSDPRFVDALVRQMMDIRSDDRRFREAMKDTDRREAAFHSYRKNYPKRRTFSHFDSNNLSLPPKLVDAFGLKSRDH